MIKMFQRSPRNADVRDVHEVCGQAHFMKRLLSNSSTEIIVGTFDKILSVVLQMKVSNEMAVAMVVHNSEARE